MTTTNKILAVSAVAAVAAYLFLKPKKASTEAVVAKCGSQEAPCGNGNGCYSILARYSQDPCALNVKPSPTRKPKEIDFSVDPVNPASEIDNTVKVNYVNTKENSFFTSQQSRWN